MSASTDDLVHRTRRVASDPEGLMVLLHGRGADEDDLFGLFDLLDPRRRLLGLSPRGPLSLPPGGAHWYVVRAIGYPDRTTFHDSFERLERWLEAVADETGLGMDRTVIGGFSQGAVMSHALALARGRPSPWALVALSGFIPTVEGLELDLDDRSGLRAAIGHGTLDPVIGVEWGRRARGRGVGGGGRVV
jgi:phospholipase/carboxylesterase